jgi:hypothetical protein
VIAQTLKKETLTTHLKNTTINLKDKTNVRMTDQCPQNRELNHKPKTKRKLLKRLIKNTKDKQRIGLLQKNLTLRQLKNRHLKREITPTQTNLTLRHRKKLAPKQRNQTERTDLKATPTKKPDQFHAI